MVKAPLHGFIAFIGTKQLIIQIIQKVGKQLNQTTNQKPKLYTIGTAQLGCPNRRLKWLEPTVV
jgi:hypothetical protein